MRKSGSGLRLTTTTHAVSKANEKQCEGHRVMHVTFEARTTHRFRTRSKKQ